MRVVFVTPCLLAGGCLLLVDPPPSAAEDDGAPDSASTGSVPGTGPTVVTFTADQTVLSDYESVTFTARVTGESIERGVLTGASASTIYGEFVHQSGDTWEYLASWTSFVEVQPVDFGETVELWARFEDADGNVDERMLELEICNWASGSARYRECVDGACIDTYADDENCGECDAYCGTFYSCQYGQCCDEYSGGCSEAEEWRFANPPPIPSPTAPIPVHHVGDPQAPAAEPAPPLEVSTLHAFDI